jgi:glycogen operon protein
VKDIMWLDTNGREMTDEQWNSGAMRCLGVLLSGEETGERDDYGEPIHDDTFLLLLNAHFEPLKFVLPNTASLCWDLLLATELETGMLPAPRRYKAGVKVKMPERSLRLYQACKPGERRKRRAYG